MNKTLYAFYDYAVSPASFDIFTFLVEAEVARRGAGLDQIFFVTVPRAEGTKRFHNIYDMEQERWRTRNIVLQAAHLLPSISGIAAAASRAEAQLIYDAHREHVFPAGYNVDAPRGHFHTAWATARANLGVDLQFIRATEQARAYARQWIESHAGGRKVVAITLREATFGSNTNSQTGEWLRFAELLDKAGFYPVILRDIAFALDAPSPDFVKYASFPEGVFNLELRMGFYEECHIATFVSNGPAMACFYDPDVRYLYVVSGEWLEANPPNVTSIGIGLNTQPAFANPLQRWLWRGQSAEVVMEAALELDSAIKQHRRWPLPSAKNLEPMSNVAGRLIEWVTAVGIGDEWRIIDFCLENAEEGDLVPVESLLSLGVKYWQAHATDPAVGSFKRALQRGRNPLASMHLGLMSQSRNDFEDARHHYREALSEVPNSAGVLFRLASVEQALGNLDVAERYLLNALDTEATLTPAYLLLGELYERSARQMDAMAVYNRAIAVGLLDQEIGRRRSALASGERPQ